MIRAVVFDLWNTLVRSQKGSPFRRVQSLLAPDQAAQVDDFMWDSMRQPYPDCRSFLEAWRASMRLDETRFRSIQETFREAALDAELFPEALEVLDRTKVLARTALLSNTQGFDMEFLDVFGISERIRTRVLSAEIGFLKPEPGAFEAVQARMGLFPGNLVMVGDSWRDDVEGALNAGWTAIWINRGGLPKPDLDPAADFIELPDLVRVPEVIERLQAGARCATCLG